VILGGHDNVWCRRRCRLTFRGRRSGYCDGGGGRGRSEWFYRVGV